MSRQFPFCKSLRLACAAAGVTILGGARAADQIQAAPIPPDAALEAAAVQPLTASYFNFGRRRPPGMAGIDSMQIARSFVQANQPDAKVVIPAGVVDCPAGTMRTLTPNGQPLGFFLFSPLEMEMRKIAAAEGKDAVPAELNVGMSSRNIIVFTGCIKVEKAGTYDFRIPCDDAAQLTIGGVVVLTTPEGGMYAVLHPPYLGRAEFVEPGIYPVEILYYDKAGDAGVEVYSTVEPKGPAREVDDARELNLLQFLPAPAR